MPSWPRADRGGRSAKCANVSPLRCARETDTTLHATYNQRQRTRRRGGLGLKGQAGPGAAGAGGAGAGPAAPGQQTPGGPVKSPGLHCGWTPSRPVSVRGRSPNPGSPATASPAVPCRAPRPPRAPHKPPGQGPGRAVGMGSVTVRTEPEPRGAAGLSHLVRNSGPSVTRGEPPQQTDSPPGPTPNERPSSVHTAFGPESPCLWRAPQMVTRLHLPAGFTAQPPCGGVTTTMTDCVRGHGTRHAVTAVTLECALFTDNRELPSSTRASPQQPAPPVPGPRRFPCTGPSPALPRQLSAAHAHCP